MYKVINKGKIYSTIADIKSFFESNNLPEGTKSKNNSNFVLYYKQIENIAFSLIKELKHPDHNEPLFLLYTKKFNFYVIIHNIGVIKEKSKQLDLFE